MKKSKVKWYKNPQPVIIGWQDAHSIELGWRAPREMTQWAESEELAYIKSMGMLLGETKNYYIITACNQGAGDFYAHIQRIPKGCVTNVEHLKRTKQKRCQGKLPKRVRK